MTGWVCFRKKGESGLINSSPLISIVVPTYNRAEFLGKAIDSVLAQSHRQLEVIVVDDCSTDGTEALVKGYDDPRVRYFGHQVNRGASAARNTGLEKAEGKYVAFLDSDDWWKPAKLEKQLERMDSSGLSPCLVYTGIRVVDAEGNTKWFIEPADRGDLSGVLLEENVVGSTSSVLVKRLSLEEIGGFDEALPSRQDLDLYLRLSHLCKFDYIKEPLTVQRRHENTITEDLQAKIEGRETLYEKIEPELREDRRKMARYLYDTGVLYFQVGDYRRGRGYIFRSIKNFPSWRGFSALLTSLFGGYFYRRTSSLKRTLVRWFRSWKR